MPRRCSESRKARNPASLVCGFAGLRHRDGTVSFAPRLPEGLSRLAFRLIIRGQRLRVEVTQDRARYLLADGGPQQIVHHGETLTLNAGEPQDRPIQQATARPRPAQPAGREPEHRSPVSGPA